MTSPTAPINFAALPKKQKFAFQQVVDKIVTNCALKRSGTDLLTEVYLAGLYHGSQSAAGWDDAEGKRNG